MMLLTSHYLFLQSYTTMVTLEKNDDTITVTEYQLCGRKYIRKGLISQMTDIKAKAVRRREGIIGYNVYIFFN